jgi:hypothetical protein
MYPHQHWLPEELAASRTSAADREVRVLGTAVVMVGKTDDAAEEEMRARRTAEGALRASRAARRHAVRAVAAEEACETDDDDDTTVANDADTQQ